MAYDFFRFRRLRRTENLRRMVRETVVRSTTSSTRSSSSTAGR